MTGRFAAVVVPGTTDGEPTEVGCGSFAQCQVALIRYYLAADDMTAAAAVTEFDPRFPTTPSGQWEMFADTAAAQITPTDR